MVTPLAAIKGRNHRNRGVGVPSGNCRIFVTALGDIAGMTPRRHAGSGCIAQARHRAKKSAECAADDAAAQWDGHTSDLRVS
jgi:hypothetical protein